MFYFNMYGDGKDKVSFIFIILGFVMTEFFLLHSGINIFIYTMSFQVVTSLADPSANIIFGAVVDDRYNGEIHVTIIATGFSQSFQKSLLTDPKAAKLVDRMSGSQEAKGIPVSLKSSTSSSTVPTRPSPRKLFF